MCIVHEKKDEMGSAYLAKQHVEYNRRHERGEWQAGVGDIVIHTYTGIKNKSLIRLC